MHTIHPPKQTGKKGITSKRYAIRLPISLAARIEALSELHPLKTSSELIADVLSLGFQKIENENKFHLHDTAPVWPNSMQPVYLLHGPFSEFHGLVRKHHLALEHEFPEDGNQREAKQDLYLLDNFD